MKLFDYLALCAAVFLTVISFVLALSIKSDTQEILIQTEDGEWVYPLESSLAQSFPGPVGECLVVIENGSVYIAESDCREQICVQSGSIDSQGEWIACMPNRIFITIRGKKEGVIDGEVY